MGRKGKRAPGTPKPPLNSYMEFCKEERTRLLSLRSMSTIELSKVVGENWRKMTAEEKKVYEERSKANRVIYEEEMQTFMTSREVINVADSSSSGGYYQSCE